MSASSAVAYHSRPRWQHSLIQSAPLLLSLLILAGTLLVYIVLFEKELHRLPGNFEWTSLINNSLPLVFVAVGQTVVVLTRGLDSPSAAWCALQRRRRVAHARGTGSMLAWSLIGLAIRSRWLLNGVLVAYGRLSAHSRHPGDAFDLRRPCDQVLPAGGAIPSPTRRSSPIRSRRGVSPSSAS
jgi:ribose transport system permease protein